VVLSDGRTERGDLLVGADGIHSQVRSLVFGEGFQRPLGGYYIATTQALRHGLPLATHTYWGAGQMVSFIPVAEDAVSSVVYTDESAGRPPHHDALAMRDYLLAVSGGFPDHVRHILGSIGADDFVFADVIAQIEMPRITKGRCALLGDAAHCPTFLSGMGSSLALQDAYTLAGCLARSPGDVTAALPLYEAVMTPIARRYHDSALKMRGLVLGRSRVKAHLRNLALRMVPERLLEREARRFFDAERPLPDVSGPAQDGRPGHIEASGESPRDPLACPARPAIATWTAAAGAPSPGVRIGAMAHGSMPRRLFWIAMTVIALTGALVVALGAIYLSGRAMAVPIRLAAALAVLAPIAAGVVLMKRSRLILK